MTHLASSATFEPVTQSMPDTAKPLSAADSRAGLRIVRWTSLVNTIRGRLEGSRLRTWIALVCSMLFWIALFLVFLEGFSFLNHHRLVTGPLIELLFGLFFASLLVMLIFSTSIILYGGLFRSQETESLLVLPIPPAEIFAFKFQEAIAFSSWGFLLLASPMLISYGISASAPWWYYPVGIPFFFAFTLLPGAVGALLTLLVALFAPRQRWQILVGGVILFLVVMAIMGLRAWLATREAQSAERWMGVVLRQLQVTNVPLLPSQWMSKGLLAASYEEGLGDSIFYLFVLSSNALAVYLLAAWGFSCRYRLAFDRLRSLGTAKRKRSAGWVDRVFDRVFVGVSDPVKVLLLKDVRIFVRDPLQWLQVIIFAGLLAIYFSNLNRVQLFASSPYWRNLLGFFNVAVTGLLLSAYTSRFIFPLMSLEGQKFWILGLAPISRRAILWGKFAFSVSGAIIVTMVLTALSAWMLRLDPLLVTLQVVSMLIICCGVSGIAVGLGARFPDIKQSDPSKIASGFGGTLNLISSLVFIVFVIATMALPCHLYSLTLEVESGLGTAQDLGLRASSGITFEQFRLGLSISVAVSLVVGVIATLWPMQMGIKAFEEREF